MVHGPDGIKEERLFVSSEEVAMEEQMVLSLVWGTFL